MREPDSLDRVEFVLGLESQFNVDVPDDVVQDLMVGRTVGEMWQVFVRLRTGRQPLPISGPPVEDPLWAPFVGLIARACGMSQADIHWDTRPFS
jgi:hypothetical protein